MIKLKIGKRNITSLRNNNPIFLDEQEFNRYKKGSIKDSTKINIPLEFLQDIKNKEELLKRIEKLFSSPDAYISLINVNPKTGEIIDSLKYSKKNIIYGLMLQYGTDIEFANRIKKLLKEINYQKLINGLRDKTYSISVDNINYKIAFSLIDSIITSSKDIEEIINDNEQLKNIPKEHLIYIIMSFFEEYQICENYILPNNIKIKYQELKEYDIEAINKYLRIPDIPQNAKINEELLCDILINMPQTLTQLEKAIYVYIKMCKLLSYDDEFYATKQSGAPKEKHKNIKYISTITRSNNKVTCYEFDMLYAIILNKLNINFINSITSEKDYGTGHENLSFRVGKFLIKADAVTYILTGDIARTKTNSKLVGITCINKSESTQNEFQQILKKIYEIVNNEEKNNENSFENLLASYKTKTNNIKKVSFREKINILFQKLSNTDLTGIDFFSYIIQLISILFSKEDIIGISMIQTKEDNRIIPKAILYFKEPLSEENLEYYVIASNIGKRVRRITKEKLQQMFNRNIWLCISDNEKYSQIPEIEVKKYDFRSSHKTK